MVIIEELQEIAAMLVGQWGQSTIIQYREIGLGETPEHAALTFGYGQVSEEPQELRIQGGKAKA